MLAVADPSSDTKNAALAIGWSQESWDEDWNIKDLPIEHKYWADLTEAEKAGASYFGYIQSTWDETESTEWTDSGDVSLLFAIGSDPIYTLCLYRS